jgi:two-component system, OmpR family, response regulator
VRVLIAEDDVVLARILERGLRAHGFEVIAVDSAASALALAIDPAIGIVVLDTSLGDFDGPAGLAGLRATRPALPVLLLTPREEDASRALSGALSADDYLIKPFAFEELIGRIRARTRRAGERRVTILHAGDLRIDLLARCAWRGERAIDLPTREFALLEYFMRHPGRVLSRADILTDVWGYNFASESNLVDVYVRYLRQRIDEPDRPSLVATVRGHGYRFDPR